MTDLRSGAGAGVAVIPAESTPPYALTVPNAVRFTGISRRTLYTMMEEGQLRATKVRGRRLFLRSDLEALLRGGLGK